MTDTLDNNNPAPETEAPETDAPAPEKPAKGPSKSALAAQIESLTAQVQTLVAANTAAQQAAEEARRASLSEAQKLTEDRAALDAERKAIVSEARQAAAEKLGIKPVALQLVPECDPRTAEGAKVMSDWAKANPDFVKSAQAPGTSFSPPPESALAQVLSGVKNSPYISTEGIRKMLNRR